MFARRIQAHHVLDQCPTRENPGSSVHLRQTRLFGLVPVGSAFQLDQKHSCSRSMEDQRFAVLSQSRELRQPLNESATFARWACETQCHTLPSWRPAVFIASVDNGVDAAG